MNIDYEKIEALNRRLERIMEEFMSFKNELFQNLLLQRNKELNFLITSTLDFMDEIHSTLRKRKNRNERRKQNVGK